MLPEHYKKRCLEFMSKEPTPVHYIPSMGTFGIHKNTKLPYVQRDNIYRKLFKYKRFVHYNFWVHFRILH